MYMHIDWSIVAVVLIDITLIITWTISASYRDSLHHIGYQRYPSRVCVDKDNLVSLYMSPYFSHGKLAILRFIIGVYCLCVLIYGGTESDLDGFAIYEYLSVWSWIVITSYFLLSSLMVLIAELFSKTEWITQPKTVIETTLHPKAWVLHEIVWIFHEISCCYVFVVFIVVWCLQYWDTDTDFRDQVMFSFYFLNMNVISIVLVYGDLFLSITPVVFDNVVFSMIFQLIFIGFSWLYYLLDDTWIYFFLKTDDFAYVVFYTLFIALVVGSSFLASKLAQWRDSIFEKRKQYYGFSHVSSEDGKFNTHKLKSLNNDSDSGDDTDNDQQTMNPSV